MEIHVFWLLLIAGSTAQENMDRNLFYFPERSVSDYVVLKPMVSEPLNKLTVCLRSYTQRGNSALLTMGTTESRISNMFVIFQSYFPYSQPYYESHIYINSKQVAITAMSRYLEWNHICVTWDSNNGVLQLWVNGKLSPLAKLQKGFSLDLQHGISLGQMQTRWSDSWNPAASFQGEISDVHMWNEVLSPDYITRVLKNDRNINGNVISWRSLNYTIKGDVIVQPKLVY